MTKLLELYGLQIITDRANFSLNFTDEGVAKRAFERLAICKRGYYKMMWEHQLTNVDVLKTNPPSPETIDTLSEMRYLTFEDDFGAKLDLDITEVRGVNLSSSEEGVRIQSIMKRFEVRAQIKMSQDVQNDPVVKLSGAMAQQQPQGRN